MDWHEFLIAPESGNYPVPASLACAWEKLEECYQYDGRTSIQRGSELQRLSETPLSTLFYFIEGGFYPPPELLIVLSDCWHAYVAAAGSLTLEEAFLGKPKKRAGNFASRKKSAFRLFRIQITYDQLVRAGQTPIGAAEAVSAQLGGKPDADSILRMMRKARRRPPSADE
ncbi:hypothetical protein [Tahibacter harae]|uniref:hypothetical protein n=1 Tax=Tahibacter harae TaxID=2963937 RepID=UPI00210D88FD|nr:hypothetical protein [Tahibacter harae]